MSVQEVFTPEEAAAFIRMSETWLMESDCRRVRFGRSVRFLRATLEAIAAQLGNSVYQVATVYARFGLTIDERLATELATSPPQKGGAKHA